MKKRVLNFFVALAMIFSFAGVMPSMEMKVEAAGTADSIVSVASNEIGNGLSKYTKWNGMINNSYTYAWCAAFVSWCGAQSGSSDVIYKTASCVNQYYNSSGEKHWVVNDKSYKPVKGDLIYFDWNATGAKNSNFDHVGIVVSYDASTNKITTIEGNYGSNGSANNKVVKTTRNYNNNVKCFLTPKYLNLSNLKPTWANLHTENYNMNYNVNENIIFNATSDYATEYYLNIDKDGQRLYCEQMKNGRFTIALKECGYYTACVTARNSQGWVDSEYIGIRVLQPVNIGNNRNVYIKNVGNGFFLTNNNNASNGNTGNVSGSSAKFTKNQLWTLIKQDNGSYKIKNAYDDQCLEVFQAGTTNGTNISVYKDSTEFTNQNFYIYNLFNAYYIKPVCSDLFVDMSFESPYNVATYGYSDNWNHQKFTFIDENDAYLICKHSYGSWTTSKNATCTENGTQQRKCSICGYTETQNINKLGHNLGNWTTSKNPTCTADGSKIRKCSICGKTETAAIAKTGHKYESKVIAPTCTEKGYTLYTCSVCKNSYKDKYTDIISHKWSDWTTSKAATCIEDGSKTRKCSVCGKIETAAIAKSGHKYESKVISPTCTAKGYTLYTCVVCQNSYKDNYVNAKGHSFEAKDENGSKIYTCSGCKFTYNVTFKGDGTAESPYLIANKNDLICLSELMQNETTALLFRTKHYLQTSDIDLQNMDWTPIGIFYVNDNTTRMYFEEGFVYDGGNHNIFNLNVNGGRVFSGLFGKINNGTVKNLAVYGNVKNEYNHYPTDYRATGGIVGELGYTGKVINCSFIGNVVSNDCSGGIVGKMWRGGTIENCYCRGNIESTEYAGGIASNMNQDNQEYVINYSIKNCYFAGSVKSKNAGGICGGWITKSKSSGNDTEKIENCYYLKSSAEKGLGSGTITKDDSTALISPILKQISPDLGESFAEKTYTGINNEYPIFTWQVPSKVKGDLDNNGKVNVSDAVAIQKCLTGKCMISDGQFVTADMNNDGILNAFDMVLAKRALEVN